MKFAEKILNCCFWGAVACGICVCVFVLQGNIRAALYNIQNEKWEKSIKLQDDYDSETESVMDFLALPTSFDLLCDTYEMLIHSDKIDYQEIVFQNIEVQGTYLGEESTIDGENKLRNQEINGGIFTPLKSVQISKEVAMENEIFSLVENNFIFKENDYFFKPAKKIPVLLGDAYKKFYSVNDEFRGIYLSRNLKFVVKGFLKNNAALYVGEDKIDLNSYIVFPALNIDFKEGKSNLFYKILYLEKVEGVIRCDSREEYKVAVKEIKSISQSTGFMYEKHLLDMYQEIELDEVVLSAGILIFLLVMLIFKIKKHYKRKEK